MRVFAGRAIPASMPGSKASVPRLYCFAYRRARDLELVEAAFFTFHSENERPRPLRPRIFGLNTASGRSVFRPAPLRFAPCYVLAAPIMKCIRITRPHTMDIPRIHPFLLLLAVNSRAQAPDDGPPSAAEPAPTDIQNWIATTDTQRRAAFNRDVSDVYESELGRARTQYAALVDTAIAEASGAGDIDGAVALRNERNRFFRADTVPEEDEAADAASVKQARAAYRSQFARQEKDQVVRAQGVVATYGQALARESTLNTSGVAPPNLDFPRQDFIDLQSHVLV